MRCIWSYSILILLYNISKSTRPVTGGVPDSKLATNRYNAQHQEKTIDETLCLNTKDGYATPAVALEMTSHLISSQSQTGNAENSLQHDHQIQKSSYNLLSEAMSQAVSHEFSKFNTFLL